MNDEGHGNAGTGASTGQPQPEPAVGAREVVIDVEILDDTDPDNVECRLSSHDGIIQNGRLVFSNDHHPGFVIKFRLTNTNEYSDYVFPNPVPRDPWHDAIWAKPVDDIHDPCPHEEHWNNFRQMDVCDENKSVRVHNPNPSPPNPKNPKAKSQLFKYALRFSKHPESAAVAMCDPIGENQNGPVSLFG
jgi:hypothetical protein